MARLMIIFLVLILMAFSAYPSLVTSRKLFIKTKRHEMLLTAREEEKSRMTHVTKSKFTVGRFQVSTPSPGAGHSGGGR
ncbi:unnamed protein product [Eruca vesicaria subsp. sativa]|uniref:Transmembrane protein n=1 Tax=Eruca vesicaria subsp. sativa TaxID=29727 RepID=A0ABC8M0U8_ERUVS|nr:unnamed protein product [Eruca vesicaria subsp. sativa]